MPAAEGTVLVTSGPNQNTRLKITVHHLAHPDRLGPGATVFVVWARPAERGASLQNLGALRVDNDLDGSLETVTPLRNFELLITAEAEAGSLQPSGEPLISARVNRSS